MFIRHPLWHFGLLFGLLWLALPVLAEPVDITSDQINRTADGVVVARGHVIVKRESDTLTADEVRYLGKQHILKAKGHVVITSDKATIQAEDAMMHTGSKTGLMHNATVFLPNGERLTAKQLKRIDDQTLEADELTFSSCPVGDDSWRIAASHGVLDQQEGSLTTHHSRLELGGIPVLYTPWWQQATRRKSGLLMPILGVGKRRGTEVSLPYYIAPSENWDATLTPHWMSARGVMGEAELRHASVLGSERINFAGIHDTVTNTNRGRLQGKVQWQLPANMRLAIDADHVSDFNYMADYSTANDISTSYLQSLATLSQSGQYGSLSENWFLQAQNQQSTLLQSSASILQILPRFQSNMQWALPANALLHINQQTTRFGRKIGERGWRVDVHPYIELPWQLAGGGVSATLTAGSHHTRYWLQQSALSNTTPTRTTGEVSLSMRSDFEAINDSSTLRHVISPIVRYDYIAAPNQSALPNFDSGFAGLTMANLFSGNRFTGYDRIERINRFSLMLESKIQSKNLDSKAVRDILVGRIGAAYDLIQQSIDPARQAAATRPFSNLLGELAWNPLPGMNFRTSGQYETAKHFLATMTATMNLIYAGNQLHVGYTFTDKQYAVAAKLVDAQARLSLSPRWHATGSVQYDVLRKFSQQAAVGLQYDHACWRIGVEGYRINRRSGTTTTSNFGVHLLLEFKGLGSVGS